MPYDEELAQRVRKVIGKTRNITEQKMFGGLAFMREGHMFCGVLGKDLIVRLGREGAAEALVEPHGKFMDFTGKVMKTMVQVAPAGTAEEEQLRAWVQKALRFVKTLQAKEK